MSSDAAAVAIAVAVAVLAAGAGELFYFLLGDIEEEVTMYQLNSEDSIKMDWLEGGVKPRRPLRVCPVARLQACCSGFPVLARACPASHE